LKTHKNKAFELECFVSMTGGSITFAAMESAKDVADTVAQLIWKICGYRCQLNPREIDVLTYLQL
jgi:hypothetical protein